MPQSGPATEIAAGADSDLAAALPLSERQSSALLELLPGVQRNGRTPLGIYGQSEALGVTTLDEINLQKSLRQSAVADFSLPALRIDETTQAFVDIGSIAGCGCAHAGFTTSPGSNALHGSVYAVWLPSGTAAQYWSDNAHGTPSSRAVEQFGVRIGGALKRNRLFYSANIETDRNNSQ